VKLRQAGHRERSPVSCQAGGPHRGNWKAVCCELEESLSAETSTYFASVFLTKGIESRE
jgi:hypothetical protein